MSVELRVGEAAPSVLNYDRVRALCDLLRKESIEPDVARKRARCAVPIDEDLFPLRLRQ